MLLQFNPRRGSRMEQNDPRMKCKIPEWFYPAYTWEPRAVCFSIPINPDSNPINAFVRRGVEDVSDP